MQDDTRYRLAALTNRAALAGLAAIGLVIGCLAAGFVYVAGWLSPERLTQARMIDTFEAVNGTHPGFRRNHAKVRYASLAISRAMARVPPAIQGCRFANGSVPVVGRFALAGGEPAVPDGPVLVRSLALSFRPPQSEEWRTGMNDISPSFRWPRSRASTTCSRPGGPIRPPASRTRPGCRKFLADYPGSAQALQRIKATTFATGFANASYNSLNAFRFVDAGGAATLVRWAMAASQPFVPISPEQGASPDKNYLFDDLAAQLARAHCNGSS